MSSYSSKLRALADYLESHDLDGYLDNDYEYPTVHIWTTGESQWKEVARKMGSGRKTQNNGILSFKSECSEDDGETSGTVWTVMAQVVGVCKRIPKGTVQRKVHIPSNAIQAADGTWYTESEEYDYECPTVYGD